MTKDKNQQGFINYRNGVEKAMYFTPFHAGGDLQSTNICCPGFILGRLCHVYRVLCDTANNLNPGLPPLASLFND